MTVIGWSWMLVAVFTADAVSQESSPSDGAAKAEATETAPELADSVNEPPLVNESSAAPAPSTATAPREVERKVTRQDVIASLTIFALAVFVGFEVITKVPPTLHTPLMSGSNAISGITVVGALIVASVTVGWISPLLGFIAVTLATINAVGGFLVTHRMLEMFKRK
jgi:NAD(P) transhydrogenase subunit alpha